MKIFGVLLGMHRFNLYLHTLRFLKLTQIWGRVVFLLYRPKPDMAQAPTFRLTEGEWVQSASRLPSMRGPLVFYVLNQEYVITSRGDWNSSELSKLALYNLHYFDDLNALRSSDRYEWHQSLITKWIADNSPGSGVGWEPYPLSIRVTNWIKWGLAGNTLDDNARDSLAIQTRFLVKRLEHHILGNHLFVNAKALIFAGCVFDGEEADSWFKKGMSILEREVPEQILSDGGQFERSPMYHSLAYEDVLDLVNLAKVFPTVFASYTRLTNNWDKAILQMQRWLRVMCHPDNEISFFNDAALGVAPSPDQLFAYTNRLGYPVSNLASGLTVLQDSGYIRVQLGEAVLLIDTAHIGPDYLPGHAHADTLSYEFSLHGKRLIVNSGTSQYEMGKQRNFERSTKAHNTVEIDGENSSEVWAGFRVARRARPFDISIQRNEDEFTIVAAHDGYERLRGKPVHRRKWKLTKYDLQVTDWIDGEFNEAISRVYFHPDFCSEEGRGNKWMGRDIEINVSLKDYQVQSSYWYPEFSVALKNQVLIMPMLSEKGNACCKFSLDWA